MKMTIERWLTLYVCFLALFGAFRTLYLGYQLHQKTEECRAVKQELRSLQQLSGKCSSLFSPLVSQSHLQGISPYPISSCGPYRTGVRIPNGSALIEPCDVSATDGLIPFYRNRCQPNLWLHRTLADWVDSFYLSVLNSVISGKFSIYAIFVF